MPTLGEFVLYAERHFNFDRRTIRLEGPEGIEELPYLWRNDRAFAEVPSSLRDSDRLTKNQVESLCARNLVEAHILHSIRHTHQVKLRKVRSALDYVEHQFGDKHPLATQQFQTDGIELFIDKLGELIIASAGGQVALREAFETHLKRVEHDERGMAARLFPFTRPSHADQPTIVVIDPRVSFGRPIIVGSGVPTSAIVERYHAGESTEHLAKDYRRSPEEIEEAVRCKTSRA